MKRKVLWGLAAGWMILIFWFSAQPANDSAAISGGVTEKILQITMADYEELPQEVKEVLLSEVGHLIRKAAHFAEYAVLGVLILALLAEYVTVRWWVPVISWAAATLYAATDECHQLFVAGRSGKWADVCLDSCGAVFGIIVCLICCMLMKSGKRETV